LLHKDRAQAASDRGQKQQMFAGKKQQAIAVKQETKQQVFTDRTKQQVFADKFDISFAI
jgi:hypothetical protein